MEQLETLGCEFQLPSTQLVWRRPESVREGEGDAIRDFPSESSAEEMYSFGIINLLIFSQKHLKYMKFKES